MNRHERRAAEARERKKFEDYRDLFRKAFHKADDRSIGESFMRGARIAATGADYITIHPTGEPPSAPADDDLWLSAAYGPQRFLARTPRRYLQTLVDTWPDFVRQVRGTPFDDLLAKDHDGDGRTTARDFVIHSVIENLWDNAQFSALTAAAIAWLTKTSPLGEAFGEGHNVAHYEISEQDEPSRTYPGKRARNFRLALVHELSDLSTLKEVKPPLPQW